MISAFANSFKIPELRRRIIFTLMILVVVQIGSHITLPGVDPSVVHKWVDYLKTQGGGGGAPFAQLLNVFSGGGIAKCALFALGIMPYISASIMMQLLTAVVPRLEQARQGGRRAHENQPVDPLHRHRALYSSGVDDGQWAGQPGAQRACSRNSKNSCIQPGSS